MTDRCQASAMSDITINSSHWTGPLHHIWAVGAFMDQFTVITWQTARSALLYKQSKNLMLQFLSSGILAIY